LKLKLLVNPSRSEKLCTAGSEGLRWPPGYRITALAGDLYDSGNPQGSVFSYVDSIRIHIDRSAIGLVFPISGSDGTNGAVRRSHPYRAIGSLFDINIFKTNGLRLGTSPGLFGETSARLLCWPTLFSAIDKNTVGMLFGSVHVVQRCASWNLQAAPARTESRPTLYLACPSQMPDATSGKAFCLREIRDAPILQKADAASLVADPEATFGIAVTTEIYA